MAYTETEIKFNDLIRSPFWAIVRESDKNGYHTGTKFDRVFLIESSSACELGELLGDGSVKAGESMGDYTFEVLALYTSWECFNQEQKQEEYESLCERESEKESQYDYDRRRD